VGLLSSSIATGLVVVSSIATGLVPLVRLALLVAVEVLVEVAVEVSAAALKAVLKPELHESGERRKRAPAKHHFRSPRIRDIYFVAVLAEVFVCTVLV